MRQQPLERHLMLFKLRVSKRLVSSVKCLTQKSSQIFALAFPDKMLNISCARCASHLEWR